MEYIPRIAVVGSLIGDTARAFMLSALMDGRARSATEMALVAGVTPQTASAHLAKLVDAGLLAVERRGRNRFFQLASADVASALESLMVLGEAGEPVGAAAARGESIRAARTCYDHLAGGLGVAIMEALKARRYVVVSGREVRVTVDGEALFERLGIDLGLIRRRRRAFARTCEDWSERRHHLAGALGAALAEKLAALDWIRPKKRSRALTVTPKGRRGLEQAFGIDLNRTIDRAGARAGPI